jgi:hypothetical protein
MVRVLGLSDIMKYLLTINFNRTANKFFVCIFLPKNDSWGQFLKKATKKHCCDFVFIKSRISKKLLFSPFFSTKIFCKIITLTPGRGGSKQRRHGGHRSQVGEDQQLGRQRQRGRPGVDFMNSPISTKHFGTNYKMYKSICTTLYLEEIIFQDSQACLLCGRVDTSIHAARDSGKF